MDYYYIFQIIQMNDPVRVSLKNHTSHPDDHFQSRYESIMFAIKICMHFL